jgi:hypothetical protein
VTDPNWITDEQTDLPCYLLYVRGLLGWGGRLTVTPGRIRCIPWPGVGGFPPVIEHTAKVVEVVHPRIWPWGSCLVLVGRHGVRHLASDPGGTTWDWDQLEQLLAQQGFVIKHRATWIFG